MEHAGQATNEEKIMYQAFDAVEFKKQVKNCRAIIVREDSIVIFHPDDSTTVFGINSTRESYDQHSKSGRILAHKFIYSTDEQVQTIFRSLRKGDQLSAEFVLGNNSQYLREAGLNCDECYLTITRGAKRLKYLFEVSICPNNSARMVRPT